MMTILFSYWDRSSLSDPGGGSFRSTPVTSTSCFLNQTSNVSCDSANIPSALPKSGISM